MVCVLAGTFTDEIAVVVVVDRVVAIIVAVTVVNAVVAVTVLVDWTS